MIDFLQFLEKAMMDGEEGTTKYAKGAKRQATT